VPVFRAPTQSTHQLGPVQFTSVATPSIGTVQTTLWKIEVPVGAPATPHMLSNEELFYVVSGTAKVRMNDADDTAAAGDCIVVPREVVFELTNGGDDLLVLVSCMPVGTEVIMGEMRFVPPWTA
jgi:mannose-6-phosphate isomerase-like protein (cupin superfamily)